MIPISAIPRFINRLITCESGCIEYVGYKSAQGYGRIMCNGKTIYAHRFSYEMHKGEIPDGLSVLHHCDNPACCNIDHLFLGTQLDNINDRNQKGRTKGGKPKLLTDAQIDNIKKRLGTTTVKSLANEYLVSTSVIYKIKQTLQGQ